MADNFQKKMASVTERDDETTSQESLLDPSITKLHEKRASRRRIPLIIAAMACVVTGGVLGFIAGSFVQGANAVQDDVVFGDLGLAHSSGHKSSWSTEEVNSTYLQAPSPEVDAAWDELSLEDLEMITISADQARALGRDVKLLSRVPEDWGLGPDRYFAQIQVFHLIHCLDAVRKWIHYDHYHLAKFGKNPPPEFMNHKNHCLHMLLENLLCQSSTDIITHNWRETYHVPIADFDPPRQCRNFDALRTWGKEHAIPNYRSKWVKLQVPSDAAILPAPTPRLY
ncbi:Cyclochlorotine biosynthesis protein O [Paramyrothecium foliicola]|nr:Cyclochlorotine biosynthesis protein O [Paramyrothecium foliicola]